MRMPTSRRRSSRVSGGVERLSLSDVLRMLASDDSRERIFIGDLMEALGDRAIAALMFIFALPNVIPTPPGTSSVLGLPLVFLSAQLAFGRKPWLPAFISNRSMSLYDFRALVRRVIPPLTRAERLLRPRASWLVVPPMEYVAGLVCFVLSVILVLPIPFGNMTPALAISLMALGIMECDGWWVLAGFVASVVSGVIVSGVLFAMFKTAVFFVHQIL